MKRKYRYNGLALSIYTMDSKIHGITIKYDETRNADRAQGDALAESLLARLQASGAEIFHVEYKELKAVYYE